MLYLAVSISANDILERLSEMTYSVERVVNPGNCTVTQSHCHILLCAGVQMMTLMRILIRVTSLSRRPNCSTD